MSKHPRNVQVVRPPVVSPRSSTAGQGSVRIWPVSGLTTSGCRGKGVISQVLASGRTTLITPYEKVFRG